ncbi:MAG: glycoside hydrolase family 9 protein [Opitutaceae bacterium]
MHPLPFNRGRSPLGRLVSLLLLPLVSSVVAAEAGGTTDLVLDRRECFSRRGLDVLVFNNWYDGAFSDAKIAGVELIHHDVRTATNGDVRLEPTPGQWDEVPALVERKVLAAENAIETHLAYAAHGFEYTVRVEAAGDGVRLRVMLAKPLPAALVGKAGFNLEFLPSAYFGRAFLADAVAGVLPRHPVGPTRRGAEGRSVRAPFAAAHTLVLAPEDPLRRVTIEAQRGRLALHDGRNQAQNGWFVVRGEIPAGESGTVVDWLLRANTVPDWTRATVIGHSQVGYHPRAAKRAVLECDPHAKAPGVLRVLKIAADGATTEVFSAPAQPWGPFLRYAYFTADFSEVREPGLYVLEAGGVRTAPFRIAEDLYADAWHATLDVFLPQQMDHMNVREAHRVWHGLSHMDDARQAAPGQKHFDLYEMSPETDSPFQAGEHIPGLTLGGWYDAGDFDLRTQTHYALVRTLVHTWEDFRPERDETFVSQDQRQVEMHRPDGEPDLIQQIEHGTLMLLAQHRVFGHAIPGIVDATLHTYTHLGDGASQTDNKIDDPADPLNRHDDRLAFTTATTALNYGSAAALAAASRALRGYRDALADECLATAVRVWEFEHSRTPNLFHFGNTTGHDVELEEFGAAVELLLTTRESRYAQRIEALSPRLGEKFAWAVVDALRAIPAMGAGYADRLKPRLLELRERQRPSLEENPYHVPLWRGGWAGNSLVVNHGVAAYLMHRAFPDTFPAAPVLRSIEYLHGCHPASDLSFVSAVGTRSKQVAYGNNRAEFTFIAGGIVPGILVLKPDFPENKEDWPFFWGENEYVVDLAGTYIYLAHAAQQVAGK